MPRRCSRKLRTPRAANTTQRSRVTDREVKQGDLVENGALGRRRGLNMLRAPLRILGQHGHFFGAMVRANHGKRRQQHRDREQDGRRPFEKWF